MHAWPDGCAGIFFFMTRLIQRGLSVLAVVVPAGHTYCSGRGICDTDTGVCDCYPQFSGVNCGTTGVIWSSTTLDILLLHSELDFYSGNLLHLRTERWPSSAFYHMYIESDDQKTFTMRGDGYTVLHRVSE